MSLQHAVAQLGGELCGFDVVANPATLQKVADVPAGLASTGARLVEASCRQAPGAVRVSPAAGSAHRHSPPAADHLQLCVPPMANTKRTVLAAPPGRLLGTYQGEVCLAGQRPQTC